MPSDVGSSFKVKGSFFGAYGRKKVLVVPPTLYDGPHKSLPGWLTQYAELFNTVL